MQKLWEAPKETKKNERFIKGRDLVDIIFSWSLLDVLNSNLYRGKVSKIPNTFQSTREYFNSFVNPIIEETHAGLLSSIQTLRRAQAFKFGEIKEAKDFKFPYNLYYEVNLDTLSENVTNGDRKLLEFNDLIAVTYKKPNRIDDLRFSHESHLLALVVDKTTTKSVSIHRTNRVKSLVVGDQSSKGTLWRLCCKNNVFVVPLVKLLAYFSGTSPVRGLLLI